MFLGFTLSIKVVSGKAQKLKGCDSSPRQVHTTYQSACPEFRTAKSPCIMCVRYTGDVQYIYSASMVAARPFSLGKLGTSVEESTVYQGSVEYIGEIP